MHTLALIIGGVLMLNCGGCLVYAWRKAAGQNRFLRKMGATDQDFQDVGLSPHAWLYTTRIPLAWSAGLLLGGGMFIWGMT